MHTIIQVLVYGFIFMPLGLVFSTVLYDYIIGEYDNEDNLHHLRKDKK